MRRVRTRKHGVHTQENTDAPTRKHNVRIVMVTALPDPLTPLLGPAKTVAWPLTLTLPPLAIAYVFVVNIEHLQL